MAFVLLNLALWPVALALDTDPISKRYGKDTVRAVYPGWAEADLRTLLDETWAQRSLYQPFVQYKEGETQGRYVNVTRAGYRRSHDQGPWPPSPQNLNLFLFGGSTLFGYGVADHETVASQLQIALSPASPGRPVKVYNFGQGGYYSSQERILFQELLLQGYQPDLALFLDGLNDFYFDAPMHTGKLDRLYADRPGRTFARACRHLPALELALDWLETRADQPLEQGEPIDPAFDDPAVLDDRVQRYLGNRELIRQSAEHAAVQVVFVVQPVPTFRYNLAHHPFARWGFAGNSAAAFGYPRLQQVLDRDDAQSDSIWAADIQQDEATGLYVDQVHYSAHMSRLLARYIADQILQRELLAS